MEVHYGTLQKNVNVTEITNSELKFGNLVMIPKGDCERASIFKIDPHPGKIKNVFIEFDNLTIIIPHDKMYCVNEVTRECKTEDNLNSLQNKLKITHGNFKEEYQEQLMAFFFLNKNDKVLELGSNIGRNSLIIASILENQKDFVTLECDPKSCEILKNNKELNNFQFNIENSALSYRKLIQKGWETIPSDVVLQGYSQVNVITLDQLIEKYNVKFNTLVADCEGALYYTLQDNPNLFNDFNKIIVENDYTNFEHKKFVDQNIIERGFKRVFHQIRLCYAFFYEVWMKNK